MQNISSQNSTLNPSSPGGPIRFASGKIVFPFRLLIWILVGIGLSAISTWANEITPNPLNPLVGFRNIPDFVRIESGVFQLGSIDSEPGRQLDEVIHQVQTNRPLHIGRTEATNAQMLRMLDFGLDRHEIVVGAGKTVSMTAIGSRGPTLVNLSHTANTVTDGHLVVAMELKEKHCTSVTWYGARSYANLCSIKMGLLPAIDLTDSSCAFSSSGFHLLTESNWEYTCRARSTDPLGSIKPAQTIELRHAKATVDSNADKSAWFGGNSTDANEISQPIATKPPNIWALYDMRGNVSEWYLDWDAPYNLTIKTDPPGPTVRSRRSVRGGDHIREASPMRSAKSDTSLLPNPLQTRGSRVAQTIAPSYEAKRA